MIVMCFLFSFLFVRYCNSDFVTEYNRVSFEDTQTCFYIYFVSLIIIFILANDKNEKTKKKQIKKLVNCRLLQLFTAKCRQQHTQLN